MQQIFWGVFIALFASCVSVFASDSIEVGFVQEDEPEPHFLMVESKGEIEVFELPQLPSEQDRKIASLPTPTPKSKSRSISGESYTKRFHQAVDERAFFEARQVKPKGRCRDKYILRIQQGEKFRERRGCAHQEDDPFADLAQLIFKDAFLAYRSGK